MRKIILLISVIIFLSTISYAKDMPVPHFNESQCDCPGLDWPVTDRGASYGLELVCTYERDKTDRGSPLNSLTLHITSWYDPEDTKEALEIFRNYDYKNEKSVYDERKVFIEDINIKEKVSFISRTNKAPTQYHMKRKVLYGTNSLISVYGYHYQKGTTEFIDDEVIAWVDALEDCSKALIDNQDLSTDTVKGKISIAGFPVKYATMYVEEDDTLKTTTDVNGAFSIKVPNDDSYTLVLEFQYQKNDHIFFRVIGENREEPLKIVMDVYNNKITSMELDYGDINHPIESVDHDLKNEIKLENFFNEESEMQGIPFHYLHMQEALEYYTDVLKVDLSKNTVDLLVYRGEGASYDHENDRQWIMIDHEKSSYVNQHRPYIHYHEFTHYVHHVIMGNAIDTYLDTNNINHGGYANQKTADSFSEGLAAYMSTIIADHYKKYWADQYSKQPSLYPLMGSLEPNLAPWEYRGQAEEYSIAGILWDLTDGTDEAKRDGTSDNAIIRKTLEETFQESDFNKDNVLDRSEFIHSLLNQEEYNPNFDGYYDEREVSALARDLAEDSDDEKEVAAIVKKLSAYASNSDYGLSYAEMHKFIKDNMKTFEARLKEFAGENYDDLPNKITVDMMMDKIEETPDDDSMDLSVEELWKIISKPHPDFTSVYNALLTAYSGKKKQIDGIFVRHGFFIDESGGDKTYNYGEPFLDVNENKRHEDNEPYVDLGVMKFTGLEKIGTPSNYQRTLRKSFKPFEGQFIKVNPEVPFYGIIYVSYNVDYFGLKLPSMVYTIRASNDDGLIYVPIPPKAEMTIVPEGVTAEEPLQISSDEFRAEQQQAEEDGFFAEHTFEYTGTPPEYTDILAKKDSSKAKNWVLFIVIIALITLGLFFFKNKRHKMKKH
ncbi:MAG: hypothetical protein ACP5OA_03380 [Candidatus Woesearchaeota archaeon]